MTKKQFTLKNWDDYAEGDCIYYDNGEEMGTLDVLDTLNNLNDENKRLKIKNKGLQSELEIRKADVDYANKISNELFDECKQYKKENEQLKKEILWWKYRCGEDISGDVE